MIKLSDLSHVAFWIVVGAGGLWLYQLAGSTPTAHAKARSAALTEQVRKNKATAAAGPTVKVNPTSEGDVIQIAIPTSQLDGLLLHTQRCTVWRDAKTQTSAMSCEREEIDTNLDDPRDEIEPAR
ncbi:hypothetical protein RD110_15760 [Rhodoferax koreense]|uniref:Uncharacterized protein n=1 Tax=Rhodoferax koreensis TaxID=1842727 RepID=A0A1P8JXJ1_9BURK|nr:hypothetical protein [Rhodoferax koreense]APW38477.1 hypothetical protein RD110_15760 [Rhodoferax koreense]